MHIISPKVVKITEETKYCSDCDFIASAKTRTLKYINNKLDIKPTTFQTYFYSIGCDYPECTQNSLDGAFVASYKLCKAHGYTKCDEVLTRSSYEPLSYFKYRFESVFRGSNK